MRQALISLPLITMPLLAVGHGSDKPGPHGGFVQMPGAFHVEVVPNDEALHVYLLDLQITNPTVADSSINATVEHNGNVVALSCQADSEQDRFSCPLPDGVNLDAGTLAINAKRGQMPPATASYELPLDDA